MRVTAKHLSEKIFGHAFPFRIDFAGNRDITSKQALKCP